MDPAIATALASGRSVIVPTRARAAALALAWARSQLDAGSPVWSTPDILTFEAWLVRQWQRARTGSHLARPAQLLNAAQERRLWGTVLRELEQQGAGPELAAHASALQRAAKRARRSLIQPRRTASAEESLLATALAQVDATCRRRGWLSMGLAQGADLAGLLYSQGLADRKGLTPAPPLFVGVERLQGLERQLLAGTAEAELLSPLPADVAEICVHEAAEAGEEIRAAARWCRAHLQQDANRRLLVVATGRTRNLQDIGAQLWSALSEGTNEALAPRPDRRLLTVEGGLPLPHHELIADALLALGVRREPVPFEFLSRLLRSPHFTLLPEGEATRLDLALRDPGLPQWSHAALRRALLKMAPHVPGAAAFADALQRLEEALPAQGRAVATVWAGRFDTALDALGFPGARALDSRDAQRLLRWRELLDEFASLDAVGASFELQEATLALEQLAAQGMHEAASPDAAITLTADRSDPCLHYNGIWVLGLTENACPEPPRPDPYVDPAEQRRAEWPEASVALRSRQAQRELAQWRARTPDLRLSYGRFEGDVQLRPSVLLRDLPRSTRAQESSPAPRITLESVVDEQLPALALPGAVVGLRGGTRAAQLQHDCAFRAQAELRLGAERLEKPVEGISGRQRGVLMHAALEEMWRELGGSAALARLDAGARHALCERGWESAARRLNASPAPPPRRALERERERDVQLLERALELEALRAPFVVSGRELKLVAAFAGPELNVRVDRIDAPEAGGELLLDYKTGAPEPARLGEDPPEPLQLAVYALARAQQGAAPRGLALLALDRRGPQFRGACADAGMLPDVELLPDWAGRLALWRERVTTLLAAHVAGAASVSPVFAACRNCHLHAFCRIELEVIEGE